MHRGCVWGACGVWELVTSCSAPGGVDARILLRWPDGTRWPQEVFSNPDDSVTLFPPEWTALKTVSITAQRDRGVLGRGFAAAFSCLQTCRSSKSLPKITVWCCGRRMAGVFLPSPFQQWVTPPRTLCQGVFQQRESSNKNVEMSPETSTFPPD